MSKFSVRHKESSLAIEIAGTLFYINDGLDWCEGETLLISNSLLYNNIMLKFKSLYEYNFSDN